jgi:predicted DNA-binding protein (MmcQ/YjbR family)
MTWEDLPAYRLAKPGAWRDEIAEAIDASYAAAASKLPEKDRPA